jgi:hypothetical protein
MPQNEVVTLPRPQRELAPQTYSFAEIERLADYIAKSRLFGLATREQAIVMMSIAQAEGRHPAQAAKDYNVIQGRPSKTAEAMQRDFMQAGGRIEWHDLSDEAACATFSHPQGGSIRILWDIGRANKAGLAGKDMWKKYPRQMLRARCVSEGVKTIYPAATSGFYTPEEAGDIPVMALPPEPSDTTADLDQFAAVTGEAEPPPALDPSVEADSVAEMGMAALERFWQQLTPAQKRALKPRLEVLKAIAATVDDPFGLPPLAPPEQRQDEISTSPPDAVPASGVSPADAGQPFAEGDVFSQLDHEAKAATKDGIAAFRKWSKTLSRDDRDLILHMFPEYELLARNADAERGLAL